jgi:hypothetical protein
MINLSSNRGNNRISRNQGQQGRRLGLGPKGMCECTSCGNKAPHQAGTPCTQMKCPKCGSMMFRAKD